MIHPKLSIPSGQRNLQMQEINLTPRFLWFFILCYTMAIVLVNWFDARMIHLVWVDTDAGALVFPLTFLVSDLITEVYGYKRARLAIWCGLGFNFFYMGYGYLITLFPSPHYAVEYNASFDKLMTVNVRIIISSCLTYLVSEPLNSYLMAKWKIKFNGKYMGLRFLGATSISSAVDSTLFGFLAFSKTIGIIYMGFMGTTLFDAMSTKELIILMFTMWAIKVVTEFIGIPISVALAKKLKKAEQMDIYDSNTQFGVFSLETKYAKSENAFRQ